MKTDAWKPHSHLILQLGILVFCLVMVLGATSCNRVARNSALGAATGAGVGAVVGGSRAVTAGAITGGLVGAAATPRRRDYYPNRVPRGYRGYYY